ncbi:MAG: envelope stress response membrane protein PspB [Pseudomonadota bacterium]|nr:envelope stress response membrane protein PspB [Pseudomonadota bacterium]
MLHPAATLISVLFLVVVAPIWIVAHYATRWRTARALSREHEQVLGELYEAAQRMEDRAESLERILDAEAPGWRGQPSGDPQADGSGERPWERTRAHQGAQWGRTGRPWTETRP